MGQSPEVAEPFPLRYIAYKYRYDYYLFRGTSLEDIPTDIERITRLVIVGLSVYQSVSGTPFLNHQ